MHPSSGRRTPRPGGSRGPSPRSRRCRTCPSRPDIQAAQVLPRSQPSDRSDGPYREPVLSPSGPPAATGSCPNRPRRRTSRLAVLRPVGPPTGVGSRPDRTTCLARTEARSRPRSSRERFSISVPPPPCIESPVRSLLCRAWRRAAGLAGRCGSRDFTSPSLSRAASIQMQLRRDDNNNCRSVIKKLLIKSVILHNRYSIYPLAYPQAGRRDVRSQAR